MATQNRYYSNLAQGSFITNTGGVSNSDTVVTVQATNKWPTQTPFIVRFEPGTANEEVGLVTSGLGTASSPFEITRGYDGTNPLSHSQGAAIIPGFAQIDFSDPQQHINEVGSASGAHGLPPSAWGGGTQQLINTYPYTAASGTRLNMTSIPGTFNTLRIVYDIQGNGTSNGGITGGGAPFADALTMNFNGVFSSTHNGIAFSAAQGSSSVQLYQQHALGAAWCGCAWIQNPATAGRGRGFIEIPAYADTTSTKSFYYSSEATDGGADIVMVWGMGTGYSSTITAAITSVQINIGGSSSAFSAGTFWLYGIT